MLIHCNILILLQATNENDLRNLKRYYLNSASNMNTNLHLVVLNIVAWETQHCMLVKCGFSNTKSEAISKAVEGNWNTTVLQLHFKRLSLWYSALCFIADSVNKFFNQLPNLGLQSLKEWKHKSLREKKISIFLHMLVSLIEIK